MNNNHFEQNFDDVLISSDKTLLNIQFIYHYLTTESYWAKDIPLATVEMAIENSIYFGVYRSNNQIGFARVVTDKATFAYLADVFIIKEHQGNGFAKHLMNTIHLHPELLGLRRWYLTTRDAHSLYAQFGWQPITDELKTRIMTISKPDIYKQNF
jgi:N-acetylglutamate synthase-like GNAT family acetyltransferase